MLNILCIVYMTVGNKDIIRNMADGVRGNKALFTLFRMMALEIDGS